MQSAFPSVLHLSYPWVPFNPSSSPTRFFHTSEPVYRLSSTPHQGSSPTSGRPHVRTPGLPLQKLLSCLLSHPRTHLNLGSSTPGLPIPTSPPHAPCPHLTLTLWRPERCSSCTNGFGGAEGPEVGSRGAQAPGLPWLMMGEGGARAAAPPPPARAPLPVPVRLCRAARLVRRRQRRRSGPSPAWCRPRGGEPRRRPGRSRCQGAGRGAGLAAPGRPRSPAFSAGPRAIRSAAPRRTWLSLSGGHGLEAGRGRGRAAERPGHLPDAAATLRARAAWSPGRGRVPKPAAAAGGWAPLSPLLPRPNFSISPADHLFSSPAGAPPWRSSRPLAAVLRVAALRVRACRAALRGPPSPARPHPSRLSGCTSVPPQSRKARLETDHYLSFYIVLPLEYGRHLNALSPANP